MDLRSSVIRVWLLPLMCIAVFILAGAALSADKPGHTFAQGEYLVAQSDASWDRIPDAGLTIEGWYYVARMGIFDRFVLVAKPGAYLVYLRGSSPSSPSLDCTVWYRDALGNVRRGGGGCGGHAMKEGEWVHFAVQIRNNFGPHDCTDRGHG